MPLRRAFCPGAARAPRAVGPCGAGGRCATKQSPFGQEKLLCETGISNRRFPRLPIASSQPRRTSAGQRQQIRALPNFPKANDNCKTQSSHPFDLVFPCNAWTAELRVTRYPSGRSAAKYLHAGRCPNLDAPLSRPDPDRASNGHPACLRFRSSIRYLHVDWRPGLPADSQAGHVYGGERQPPRPPRPKR